MNRLELLGRFGFGIDLYISANCNISENYIVNNDGGITLRGFNNRIYENNLVSNKDSGIYIWFEDTTNNKIYRNNLVDNGAAVYILGFSSNNTFYHNNFINNTVVWYAGYTWYPPFGPGPPPPPFNAWDNGKEGNYWSDYITRYPNATEIDGSGIWDTPYVIDENNQDNYPLMKPVNISAS